MRREAICAGAILLFPFDAFVAQNAPAPTSRIIGIVVDSINGTGPKVYRPREAPAQFAGLDDCVTLVVWTQLQPQVRQH